LADDTLVVFCSDNGPVLDDGYQDGALTKIGSHRAAGPYSGGKYSVYEGGTRTPFITRWKGRIQPGVSDEVVCTIDLAASLAALVKQPLPADGCLDSFDVLNALLGEADGKGRDHLVQQNNGNNGTYALRAGEWKLHRYDRKTARNIVVEAQLANTKVPRFQLFNLNDDPAEKVDVIADQPQVASRLMKQLEEIIAQGRSRP
jgi:arylsulfatase A